MRKYLLCLCIGLSTGICHAQNYDSLEQNIVNAREVGNDSIVMSAMFELAFEYYYSSADSLNLIIEEAEKCLQFASKIKNVKGQMSAMNLKAICLRKKGDYEGAFIQLDEIIALANKTGNLLRAAQMMDNKANNYLRLGKYDEALKNKFAALKIFVEIKDSSSLSTCYNGIGSLYLEKKNYDRAIENFYLSIGYADPEKRDDGKAYAYGNLAMVYKNINQKDSALHYYLKCRESSKTIKYLYDDNEAQLAKFYAESEESGKAIEIYEGLINNFSDNSTDPSLHFYRMHLANTYFQSGRFKDSKRLFDKIDTSYLYKSLNVQLKFNKLAYQLSKEKGDFENALNYYVEFRDSNDSLNSVERNSRFKEIESKYDVAEKEKIIGKQNIQLKNRMLFIGGLLSLFLISFLFFSQRQKSLNFQRLIAEQKSDLQDVEIESLKKENKIVSMQSMLEGQEEERIRIARDLHDNIGSLMTTIKMKVLSIQKDIQSIEKMNITKELDSMITNASQEVRRISHRMTPVALDIAGLNGALLDLEQQLQSHGIQFNTDIDELEMITDKQLSINIYRIVQEMINNVIKHAEADQVSLTATIQDGEILMSLADNGKGISLEDWKEGAGLGISGVKSRVDYLNGTIDLIAGQGTKFEIKIPIEK